MFQYSSVDSKEQYGGALRRDGREDLVGLFPVFSCDPVRGWSLSVKADSPTGTSHFL